jgi:hypothetical protein
MKPKRSIKELLVILRDNLERCFKVYDSHGMCDVAIHLRGDDIIIRDEYNTLKNYLSWHTPIGVGDYWFPEGELAPRLEWLNQQIEKL